MLTPVFLDNLPNAFDLNDRKTELYRLGRNRDLINLIMDEDLIWHNRKCPACGDQEVAKHFTLSPLAFHRCQGCNSIYAVRVPDQASLDALRLRDRDESSNPFRETNPEFDSIFNWVELSAGRHGKPIKTMLDYRFSSHMPSFAAAATSDARSWHHVLLAADRTGPDFTDLAIAIADINPDAVIIQSEFDRAANPRALLDQLAANLPKGAMVFVSTSCADGLEYEILGPRSPSFVPFDRLNLLSIQGLKKMSRAAGFEPIEISTPGRLDAIILKSYFDERAATEIPFWSSFFKDANRDRLQDLQVLLQRSLRSGVMRFVLSRI